MNMHDEKTARDDAEWQRVFEQEIAAKRADMARDVAAEMNRARQEAENV